MGGGVWVSFLHSIGTWIREIPRLPKVQYRALVDGAAFAAGQGDLVGSVAYSSQAAQIVHV